MLRILVGLGLMVAPVQATAQAISPARVEYVYEQAQVICLRSIEAKSADTIKPDGAAVGITGRELILLYNYCLMFSKGASYGLTTAQGIYNRR